jgi:hypothetical protein
MASYTNPEAVATAGKALVAAPATNEAKTQEKELALLNVQNSINSALRGMVDSFK